MPRATTWPCVSAASASQKHTDRPPPVARPVAVSRPVAGLMKATWMSIVTTSRVNRDAAQRGIGHRVVEQRHHAAAIHRHDRFGASFIPA